MLTLDNLRLRQGAFTLAADLTVPPGTHAAIIGPSGAGKSTLLAAIAGFLAPESGRILWNGTDLAGTVPGQRPLSVIFQDNNLFPHLTAQQNVALGLRPSLRLTAAEQDRVAASLTRVGLDGFGGRNPGVLSGGQQSRVALARVLLRARPLMLLDEPFAALGPGQRAEMLDLVTELGKETGATILMVTHNPQDALRLAGHTILVADGRAHPPCDTRALFDDPPEALSAYLE